MKYQHQLPSQGMARAARCQVGSDGCLLPAVCREPRIQPQPFSCSQPTSHVIYYPELHTSYQRLPTWKSFSNTFPKHKAPTAPAFLWTSASDQINCNKSPTFPSPLKLLVCTSIGSLWVHLGEFLFFFLFLLRGTIMVENRAIMKTWRIRPEMNWMLSMSDYFSVLSIVKRDWAHLPKKKKKSIKKINMNVSQLHLLI